MYGALSKELTVIKKWHVSGLHYHRSLEAWLQRLKIVGPTFSDSDCAGDPSQKNILHNKFRFFLIFCSELFKFNRGLDWHVDHYFMGPSRGVDS
jgi:cyclopropane-fatty-acyl-phospholipid synthase